MLCEDFKIQYKGFCENYVIESVMEHTGKLYNVKKLAMK